MEKGMRVSDMAGGALVKGVFLACEARKSQGRNGAAYWSLKLSDATGVIDGKIWAPLAEKTELPSDGFYVSVSGRAGMYRDSLQLVIDALDIVDDPSALPLEEFMAKSSRDAMDMWAELRAHCKREFTHAPWAELIFSILDDPEISAAFKTHPAAKSVHQACSGGLLEHTLHVFELCRAITTCYPSLDRQTLLAGALLHDLGKIRELTPGPQIKYTGEGLLMGHIFLGAELLSPFLAASSLADGLKEHLRHLVLSHHGELAYGAVRVPQTAEAFALHFADNLDAKIEQCNQLVADVAEGSFSFRNPLLDRMIYRPFRTPAQVEGATEEEPPLPEDAYIPADEPDEMWWSAEEYSEVMAEEEGSGAERKSGGAPMPVENRGKKQRRNSCKGEQCSLLLKAWKDVENPRS